MAMTEKSHHLQRGMVLPFVLILGVGLAILALHIARTVKFNSGQMVYFNQMNRAYRLAESGMAIALGQLSTNPSTGTYLGTLPDGDYTNVIDRTGPVPIMNGFYIVTSATVTAPLGDYSTELHTYANVSNIGTYFAALKNEFVLSAGMDATGGRIYAPNLVFLATTTANMVTRAQSVEYVYQAVAEDTLGTPYLDPLQWQTEPAWEGPPYFLRPNGGGVGDCRICIGSNQDPVGNPLTYCRDSVTNEVVRPTQLNYPMQFPSVTEGDFIRYQTLAGAHNPGPANWIDFSGPMWNNIFPPGYRGGKLGIDPYGPGAHPNMPGHDGSNNANLQHVYFSSAGIRLGRPTGVPGPLDRGTTFYGQILFVTPRTIEIRGNLFSSSDLTPAVMPGAGFASSSTAHQGVLIARTIQIKTINVNLPDNSRRVVEAFFFAPNGSLSIEYNTTNTPVNRTFQFTGSWVLGETDPQPNNLPSNFAVRRYKYMTSLGTDPPPYMPSLSEIYYVFERPLHSPNLYQ